MYITVSDGWILSNLWAKSPIRAMPTNAPTVAPTKAPTKARLFDDTG